MPPAPTKHSVAVRNDRDDRSGVCKVLGWYLNRHTRCDRAVIAVRLEILGRGEGVRISMVRELTRPTRIVRITRDVKSVWCI